MPAGGKQCDADTYQDKDGGSSSSPPPWSGGGLELLMQAEGEVGRQLRGVSVVPSHCLTQAFILMQQPFHLLCHIVVSHFIML